MTTERRWSRFVPPAPCLLCKEMVLPGDQIQYYSNSPQPVHHACFMRPIIGSVAHIEKRCGCYVLGSDDNDDPRLTRRQAAEAALAAWEQLHREDFESMRMPCNEDDPA